MNIRIIKIFAGPLLALGVYFLFIYSGVAGEVGKMAGIVVWMAYWWITEAVHLSVTALLPFILYPFTGIMAANEVGPLYMHHIIFLFIGGFLLAFAMEKWALHKRIALAIIVHIGHTPARILMGIMLSAYLLSMWISNTATTMMLLPAVLGVISEISKYDKKNIHRIAVPFLLGAAYASNIGGTATIVGTPPTQAFLGFFQSKGNLNIVTFFDWMLFGIPLSLAFVIVTYFVLQKMYFPRSLKVDISLASCREEYRKLGSMTFEEKLISVVFTITVLLWIFRAGVELGDFTIKGWASLFEHGKYIQDSTVAMAMAGLLFLMPSKKPDVNILEYSEIKKLPIGIIFLFGGGFALAKGVEVSGLSDWLAGYLKALDAFSPFVIVLILSFFMTFLTDMASNIAMINLVLPIVYGLAEAVGLPPLLLLIPVTFAASYAFMLPVSTPPNTIVYGSEMLRVKDMVRSGIVLNLIGIVLLTLFMFLLGRWVFEV